MFLIILKGSSGTPATLVMTAESAIFPFTWWEGGKGNLFLREKYINRSSTFIFLTFCLKKKPLSDIALPLELLLQSVAFATALKENLQVLIKNKTVLLKALFNLNVIIVKIPCSTLLTHTAHPYQVPGRQEPELRRLILLKLLSSKWWSEPTRPAPRAPTHAALLPGHLV